MPRAGPAHLLIHAVGPLWSWLSVDAAGKVLARGACDPAGPDWPEGMPCRVLEDARRCTGLRLDLPELPAARLDQALRWAAEEHLAGAADDEHVVAAGRAEDGRLNCVVIDNARMAELATQFGDRGLAVVCPDALCLPWIPGQISLGRVHDSVLVRWGHWEFGSFEPELAAEVVAAVMPERCERVWYGGELPGVLSGPGLQQQGEDLFEALIKAALQPPINLLSGRWRPQASASTGRRWRWAAGLAAAVVVAGVGTVALERHLLRSEGAELQSAIEQRFATAFPGVTPAGRHRELAERELARLRFGQSAGLLDLMYRAAPVLSGQGALSIDGLSFRDGQLELRLRAPDVAALDELERRLRALDLDAAVQSASLDAQGASGRVRVSERRG